MREPYDWLAERKPTDFQWSNDFALQDADGTYLKMGGSVIIQREAVAFDEKGQRVGIWPAGEIVVVSAASEQVSAVYFEGVFGAGWASGVISPTDVKLIEILDNV